MEYSKVQPPDIIVLMDGMLCALIAFVAIFSLTIFFVHIVDDPASVISEAVARLRYRPNNMNIQFVQIGDEPDAKQASKDLVEYNLDVRYDDRSVAFTL